MLIKSKDIIEWAMAWEMTDYVKTHISLYICAVWSTVPVGIGSTVAVESKEQNMKTDQQYACLELIDQCLQCRHLFHIPFAL